MVAKLRQVKAELRRRMHDPVSSVARCRIGYSDFSAMDSSTPRFASLSLRTPCHGQVPLVTEHSPA